MAEFDGSRTCTKCKIEKALTEYTKVSKVKSGLSAMCKSCCKAYRSENRDRILARKRQYHKDIGSDRMKLAYRENLAANPALNQEQYANRAEYHKTWMKQWRLENPEAAKAKDAADRVKFKDRIRKTAAVYRLLHAEQIKAQYQDWCKNNRDAIRAYGHNRRAKLASAGGKFSASDEQEMFKSQKGKCAICKKSIKDVYDRDHIYPLSRGGSNDKSNIQLLCIHCNRNKHAKDPIDFMQSRGFLL